MRGYRYEPNKFSVAGVTAVKAVRVNAPLVEECPVQIETKLVTTHKLAEDDGVQNGRIITIELRVVCVHAEDSLLMENHVNRIDPNKWRPLIMSFQKFYGLGRELQHSTLAEISEELYKTPDMEKAEAFLS
jgi:flavin reductase (DIM6/NTAB) family NADH-FMN oxidoreductase RutF